MNTNAQVKTSLGKVVPAAAIIRPHSKWTVVIAFIVATALHISPALLVESQNKQTPVEVVQADTASAAELD